MRLAYEALQQRQHVSEGLFAARLRSDDDILAVEDWANSSGLSSKNLHAIVLEIAH